MDTVFIGPRLRRTLEKEASGSEPVFRQLASEAVARKWLGKMGIPAWRNPTTPRPRTRDLEPGSRTGYSLLFSDGSRIRVCFQRCIEQSFDDVAASKCMGIIVVDLQENCAGGTVKGFVPLSRIRPGTRQKSFSNQGLEPCSIFMHYLKRPKYCFLAKLVFSTRLLFAGEPDAPEKGVCFADV